jgi:NAD(P)-dependent dehydrogenase (short-subunit alcohol dehydrogenase family)
MYQKVNGETPAGAKVIVITGGTGGIGYQEALLLGNFPEKHTIVITGRD